MMFANNVYAIGVDVIAETGCVGSPQEGQLVIAMIKLREEFHKVFNMSLSQADIQMIVDRHPESKNIMVVHETVSSDKLSNELDDFLHSILNPEFRRDMYEVGILKRNDWLKKHKPADPVFDEQIVPPDYAADEFLGIAPELLRRIVDAMKEDLIRLNPKPLLSIMELPKFQALDIWMNIRHYDGSTSDGTKYQRKLKPLSGSYYIYETEGPYPRRPVPGQTKLPLYDLSINRGSAMK